MGFLSKGDSERDRRSWIKTAGWHRATVHVQESGTHSIIHYRDVITDEVAVDRIPWDEDSPREDRAFLFFRLMNAAGWPSREYWKTPVDDRKPLEWQRGDLQWAQDMPVHIRIHMERDSRAGVLMPRVMDLKRRYEDLDEQIS